MMKNNKNNLLVPYVIKDHTKNYPTPLTINYFYGFGFVAGVFLSIQIFSGILLAMYYIPETTFAFKSVISFRQEQQYGWFFQNMHQVGASFFFIAVYIHIARSMHFKSFYWPNTCVWWTGLLIFLLMIATAFLGYVLPWSQMGYWAATVITSLFDAIPVVGPKFVMWIWGGYSVQGTTLRRFAILHYILPFLILGLVGLHLSLLHKTGSSDSMLSSRYMEKIGFYPFFIKKDLSLLSIFIFFFMYVICCKPRLFTNIHMWAPADPLTGIYVVPEWYFLPLFGFIKCVRSKSMGIILIIAFFFLLAVLPFFVNFEGLYINSNDQFIYDFFLWNVFTSYVCLGRIAARPLTEGIFNLTGNYVIWFFMSFILLCLTDFIQPSTNKIKQP